jgi:hypothetical protein
MTNVCRAKPLKEITTEITENTEREKETFPVYRDTLIILLEVIVRSLSFSLCALCDLCGYYFLVCDLHSGF